MKRLCCQNCGAQVHPEPSGLGELPVEEIVAEDDRIRALQLQAIAQGLEPRHSISIASNRSVAYGQASGGLA